MDYRKPLFQLEQWSPKLARRIWGLTSFLELPFTLALGLRVNLVSDTEVEVEVPFNRLTTNENLQIHPTALMVAGEFATKMLWQRHLRPQFEELQLASITGRFLKPAKSSVRVRTHLPELERERVLRKVRLGESMDFEMSLIYLDKKDQHVATVNTFWLLRPNHPMALGTSQAPQPGEQT